jgi:hypothetical protein
VFAAREAPPSSATLAAQVRPLFSATELAVDGLLVGPAMLVGRRTADPQRPRQIPAERPPPSPAGVQATSELQAAYLPPITCASRGPARVLQALRCHPLELLTGEDTGDAPYSVTLVPTDRLFRKAIARNAPQTPWTGSQRATCQIERKTGRLTTKDVARSLASQQ